MINYSIKKFILCSFIALLSLPFSLNAQSKRNNFDDDSKKLNSVLQLVDMFYVDTVNNNKLVETAIKNMLKELDPHSIYFTKEEMKEVDEPLQGNFEGIGVQFYLLNDTIQVVTPTPGGPSAKLGILAGDKIIKIDGQDATGSKVNNNYVFKHLRGAKGTKVTISIKRNDIKDLIDYTVTRDKIPINSVVATFMATPDIGYIKLVQFGATTIKEIDTAVAKLKASGMKSLILDLRDNGGGYLNTAIELADDFLDKDKLVVYTKGVNSPEQKNFSTEKGNFEKGKLVILIDEGTASASEIVSGAVQDWDRGLIMGRRSFGKGLVQRPFTLPDGSVIRLTTARYYTPSGRCIQKPYTEGVDKYYKDLTERYKHGEEFHQDSIHLPDSLKFYTNGKRLVYGGGGIMPDIFVPADTSMISDYYMNLVRKGIFNSFSIKFLDKKRDSMLTKYPNAEAFVKKFKVDSVFLRKFVAYAEKQGVNKIPTLKELSKEFLKSELAVGILKKNPDTAAFIKNYIGTDSTVFKKFVAEKEKENIRKTKAGLEQSKEFITNLIMADIGTDLYDQNTFYLEVTKVDDLFKKAIDAINDKTFKKYKIND